MTTIAAIIVILALVFLFIVGFATWCHLTWIAEDRRTDERNRGC